MTKRLKIDEFVSLLAKNGMAGKEKRKVTIKEFAEHEEVSVPTSFWKEYSITGKRGYYGIPADTSITSEEEVNPDISNEIPDDEFLLEVEHMGDLVQVLKVTDLVSGTTMTSSIRSDASETSIKNVYNFYKRKLRHLH